MSVKQISVFVENKAGSLLDITEQLKDQKINIRAVSLADTTRFGILRLIVDNPDLCEKSLRAEGYTVSLTNVIVVRMRDEPGGLAAVVNALYNHGMNVDYIYAFINSAVSDACVIVRVGDIEFAEKVLSEAGFSLLSDEEASK